MALPKQVQAQLAELEELEKTLEAQKKPKLVKDEEVKPDEEQLDTEAEVTEEPSQPHQNLKKQSQLTRHRRT